MLLFYVLRDLLQTCRHWHFLIWRDLTENSLRVLILTSFSGISLVILTLIALTSDLLFLTVIWKTQFVMFDLWPLPGEFDLCPSFLTFNPMLGRFKINPYAKNQDHRSNGFCVGALTNRRTPRAANDISSANMICNTFSNSYVRK